MRLAMMDGVQHVIEANRHQALGLSRLHDAQPARVLAVTSGKGGVGKTSVAVNLAMALSMSGHETLLVDADLGLANVDVQLGLSPQRTLAHLLDGSATLDELILEGPAGLHVLPATSGTRRMAQLGGKEIGALINAINAYTAPIDAVVVDTAAGIADSVTLFACAVQEVVVVVCDEPASITDAYALIKVLRREFGISRFRVLANMVQDAQQGRELFEKIHRVTERFLDVLLDYMGAVPMDDYVRRAVRRQTAVVDVFPGSRSAQCFRALAQAVMRWPLVDAETGHLRLRPGAGATGAGMADGGHA
jgi:flagellar biosynthesis protein FlhG